MTLTFHNLDGREVQLDGAEVDYARPVRVGGKVCTRIRLSSGSDVIVSEITAEVIRRCGEADLAARLPGAWAETVSRHSPIGSSEGAAAPIKIKYGRHQNLYHPPHPVGRKRLRAIALLAAMLGVAVAAVALIAYSQKSVSAQNPRTVREDDGGVRSVALPSADSISQCESQARKKYAELILQTRQTGDYRAHYDSNVGKCFVLITSDRISAKETLVSMTLLEAFGGDNYAYYTAKTEKGTPNSTILPTVCEVTSIESGQTQYCGSIEQFQSLLRPYMEH